MNRFELKVNLRRICAVMASAVFLGTGAMASPTTDVTLEDNGVWNEFLFSKFETNLGGGNFISSGTFDIVRFMVKIDAPKLLQVTDAYKTGDRFELFATNVNGVTSLLGQTSAVTGPLGVRQTALQSTIDALAPSELDKNGDPKVLIRDNYDTAFADARFSSGSFRLETGTYWITGRVSEQPIERGRAALRLVSPVPVPASLGMLGGAFALMAGMGYARRNAKRKESSV